MDKLLTHIRQSDGLAVEVGSFLTSMSSMSTPPLIILPGNEEPGLESDVIPVFLPHLCRFLSHTHCSPLREAPFSV